jgi:hypothetical protein
MTQELLQMGAMLVIIAIPLSLICYVIWSDDE